MSIRKFRAARVTTTNANIFVGQHGDMFYDETLGQLKISDGQTAGGSLVFGAATTTKLGGIKAGPGANVSVDGTLTINTSGIPLSVGDLYITQANISAVNANEDLNLLTNGTGNVNLIGNIRVQTTSAGLYSTPVFAVDNRGNLTVNGNLITNGGTFLNGNVTFVGATIHQGNLLTNGNLITNGSSYFNGPVTEVGNLTITGNANIAGPASYYGAQSTYGDSTYSGNVTINGITTFNGPKVTVGNNTITGNNIQNGPAYNYGVSYFFGNVNTVGNLNVTGNTAMVGNVVQLGNLTIIGNTINNGTSYFNGQNNFTGNLNIIGNTFVTGNTYVNGNTFVNGPTTVTGNVTVTGNMLQSGESIFNITQQNSVQGAVEITGDANAQWQTPVQTGVMLQVTGQANLASRIYNDSLNNYALFVGRRFDGTMASPSAVQANEDLMRLAGGVYTSAGWANIGPSRIAFTTNENQTGTNQGGRIDFWTTANSSGPAWQNIQRISSIDAAVGVWATQFTTSGTVTAGNVAVSSSGTLTTPRVVINDGGLRTVNGGTALTIDFSADSRILWYVPSGDTTITLSNYTVGAEVEVIVRMGAAGRNIALGIAGVNNSTTGTTSLTGHGAGAQYGANQAVALVYTCFDNTQANCYVRASYA